MKILDLPHLLNDNNISYETSNDWVQLQCPYCSDHKQHLGFNTKSGVWNCFRCGRHQTWETIAQLLGISIAEAQKLSITYQRNREDISISSLRDNALYAKIDGVSEIKLPFFTSKMTFRHKQYLEKRGFDPDYLEREWGLLGTGAIGEFKHRIIISVLDEDGRLVCFQGRDITGKASNKYKSCPDSQAIVPIKSCLYGIDKLPDKEWVIITEGATKVWRLRERAVCTFGTVVTNEQISMLSKFERRYILFDSDGAGTEGARKLAGSLKLFGGQTEIISLPGVEDVADLIQSAADSLVRVVN